MPRAAKPFFRKEDGWWYLNIRECGRRRQMRLAEGKKNKPEADRRYHEVMALREQERATRQRPGPSQLVETILDQFLVYCRAEHPESTRAWYAGFIEDFAASIPVDLLVGELKVHHATAWLASHKSWGSSTKNGAVGAIRRAFRWAEEQGYIDHYPLKGLKAPAKQAREVIVSPEEYTGILAQITDQKFKDFLGFLWNTGCRPQEACNLRVEHCQLQLRRVVFPPSQSKGKKAPRVIYLNDAALEIVTRNVGKRKSGPVLRASLGKAWTKSAVRGRFIRLAPKIGDRQLCAYNFRHSWATHALEQGLEAVTVGILMGHTTPTMVANRYQHLAKLPEYMQEQTNKVRKLNQE